MKKIALLLIFFAALATNAQKNIYESIRFDELSSEHQELAIIPFITKLDLDDNVSKSELRTLEEKEAMPFKMP